MLGLLLNVLQAAINRPKMAAWSAEVNRIVSKPPGTDDGFTAEAIASYTAADFSRFETWEIVCEETLDTTFPRAYFVRAREELSRRGVSDETYAEMRRVAWLTAGWLNFEKMLWDWCALGERDIRRAIELQFAEGWISQNDRDRLIEFVDRWSGFDRSSEAENNAKKVI